MVFPSLDKLHKICKFLAICRFFWNFHDHENPVNHVCKKFCHCLIRFSRVLADILTVKIGAVAYYCAQVTVILRNFSRMFSRQDLQDFRNAQPWPGKQAALARGNKGAQATCGHAGRVTLPCVVGGFQSALERDVLKLLLPEGGPPIT